MKKIILSMAMLIVACSAFAQDADHLMKQYRKVKGAEYENMTKAFKKKAKKMQYIDPKEFAVAQTLEKVEILQVNLNERQREALTENIKNIDGYENLYEKKSNVTDMFSDTWTLFPLVQYYGIEESGTFKDVIIRIDTSKDNQCITIIIHIVGEMSAEEVMQAVELKEEKNITISSE